MSDTVHIETLGSGPAVVLLHAFPCTSAMWAPQARAISAAGLTAVTVDLPGFGHSPLPEGEPDLPDVAAAILAALDGLEISECVLGGISLGGYVTMAILQQRPEIARGVVLCDTKATADGEAARENRQRLARLAEGAPLDTARLLEQAVLPGLLGDTSRAERPDVVSAVRGWLGEARPASVAWYQRAMAKRPDSTEVLGGLAVPGLVVWGEEDTLSPMDEQQVMLDCLADGWLAVIEQAGHLTPVERPDAVSGVLVDFAMGVLHGR